MADGSAAAQGHSSVERFFQFSLLGLVTSGYLAVAGSGYLDAPTLLLTAAGLLVRALMIAGVLRIRISESATTLLAISYIAFFVLDYALLSRDFLTATVHLLFFLAVTKVLTAKTNRDYLYTAAIAFLELMAAAILSVDLNFFLFLALYLLFAMGALTSGEIFRSLQRSPATARTSLRYFAPRLALLSTFAVTGILAITGLLFFLLPRTAEAAFSRLISHNLYLPGFSNQVTLGQIGEIKSTSRPVMHVGVFSQEVLPGLKWRGGALTVFDGKGWSNPHPHEEPIPVENGEARLAPAGFLPSGRRINYHVQLNAVTTDTLFFAGSPARVNLRQLSIIRNETGSYRLTRVPPEGFSYDAYSLVDGPPETAAPLQPAPVLPPDVRRQYLQLPPLDVRIPKLADFFAEGAITDLERARAVERHLRHDYGYTLEMPDHDVGDPLAWFLFTRRKGYCEYFASAMTVMLRSLGIPARLATGFQSGVYNPITDLWLVRASDAHTWVEAWMPEHGWATFDPTPPDPYGQGFAMLTKLGLYVDAAQTFWQDWVVSYDVRRQGTLSYRVEQGGRKLGIRWFDSLAGAGVDWPALALAWFRHHGLGMVLLVGAALAGWLLWPRVMRLARHRIGARRVRRGTAAAGDATLLYDRMLACLGRRGYQKPAWFTPAEFAASLPGTELGVAVRRFTLTYNQWRFGGRTEVARQLSELLESVEQQRG